ncbi:MAG TPA: MAPEG family protein [Polyangiales bacterium]
MATPLLCLLGYALWAILLVLYVGGQRAFQVVTGKQAPNAFPSGVQHGSDAYWRANRAHINTTENLPIYGAVVVAGMLAHADSSRFAMLAVTALAARVVQSLIHLSSGSVMAVNLRFSAFCVQLGCLIAMAIEIVLPSA